MAYDNDFFQSESDVGRSLLKAENGRFTVEKGDCKSKKKTLRNSELDTNVLLLIYHWVNHRGYKCMCKFVRVSRNMALNLYKRQSCGHNEEIIGKM